MKITFELTSLGELNSLKTWLAAKTLQALDPNVPLEVISLSVRSMNCLKSANILTIANLITWNAHSLLMLPNMGRTSLNEIKDTLKVHGLALAGLDESTQETTLYKPKE